MNTTIVDYAKRENKEGEIFFALILEGDLEMVRSKETGRFYATARRTSIPSTFTEERCKLMIGMEIPGKIVKVASDPYDYTIPETGEVIELNYTYDFIIEDDLEKEVFETESIPASAEIAEF